MRATRFTALCCALLGAVFTARAEGSDGTVPSTPDSLDTVSAAAVAGISETAGTDTPVVVEDLRAKRGLVDTKNVFVPRGQWLFGGYASYSTHRNDSYNFFIFDDIDSDGYTFKVSPMIGYAFRDNMALGARFIYGRTFLRVDGGQLSLGDEESGTNISADFYYSLKHSYTAALFWRQYIPLGVNKRFAMFTEISLGGGGHQSKFAANSPVRGTYETGYEFSLGVSPGFIAFINNTMSIELNIGVLGLNYKHSHQIHNQVATADIDTSYMNFNVNLLSISLGVSFYL